MYTPQQIDSRARISCITVPRSSQYNVTYSLGLMKQMYSFSVCKFTLTGSVHVGQNVRGPIYKIPYDNRTIILR